MQKPIHIGNTLCVLYYLSSCELELHPLNKINPLPREKSIYILLLLYLLQTRLFMSLIFVPFLGFLSLTQLLDRKNFIWKISSRFPNSCHILFIMKFSTQKSVYTEVIRHKATK